VQFVHLAVGKEDGGVQAQLVYESLLGVGVSPGVEMRHLESRKNIDPLKRSIDVDRIGVQSTFVYIYAGLRVLMI